MTLHRDSEPAVIWVAFLAMLVWETMPTKFRHNGMHHCAFEYASFADLMSSYDRLKAGVEPALCVDMA